MEKKYAGLAVLALVCCLITYIFRKRRLQERRCRERPHLGPENRLIRGQQASLNIMRLHDSDSFFSVLRLYPEDFDMLLHIVGPYITKDDARRAIINPSTRLGLTLRYLASGESQKSLALNYIIGESTTHAILSETTWFIWKKLGPIVMPPPTTKAFQEIADGFWNRWDVPNCCGSIDGKLVQIKMPPHSGSDYWCYKSFFAMILLGWVDHRYRFVAVDTGSKGRQSDGGVFSHSELGKKLKQNEMGLPSPKYVPFGPLLPHFLLGDEAFGLSTFMMTPYPGRSIGKLSYSQQIFNYRQSRGRRIVENAFGLLAGIWRIFKTEIDADVELIDQIVMACMYTCLHNFRLILNDEKREPYVSPDYFDQDVNGNDIAAAIQNRNGLVVI